MISSDGQDSAHLSLSSLQNKLKKIKEKYKDQDEEDRELMMQLLAVRVRTHDPMLLLWLCGEITDELLFFFSLLVPPRRRRRRRRGRKERRGREKKSPLESLPLRNQPRNLLTWRQRNQRRWEERKREERKEELLNRRRRYDTSGGADSGAFSKLHIHSCFSGGRGRAGQPRRRGEGASNNT